MSWMHVENSDDVKPLEIDEISSNTVVYIRKNFKLIEGSEERPEHYEYDEQQIDKKDWEIYKSVIDHDSQLTDTELAIVELYEMISKGVL